MQTVRVSLAPSPGFCIKTAALKPALCNLTPPPPSPGKLDVPTAALATLAVPQGLKIFVNIAWDRNVPPPPHGSDEVIQKAMLGDDDADADNDGGWFVPVVVSEPREDRDKAGKPSAVFDCVYHSSLKARALRDPEFKTFLIELAFQRIEAQHGLLLSRQIGTPNIKFKGELKPRTVLIPAALFPGGVPPEPRAKNSIAGKKLVEDVSPATKQPTDAPQGILKKPAPAAPSAPDLATPLPSPDISWSKSEHGLTLYLKVPNLTHTHIPSATLDLEPRRLILHVPPVYALDLDLDTPDAQIRDSPWLSKPAADQVLTLKRQRDFDVDHARAEWRVGEGRLVVHV